MAEKIVEAISEESIEKIAGGLELKKEDVLNVVKKVGIPVLALGVGAAAGAAAGIGGTLAVEGYMGEGPLKGKIPGGKKVTTSGTLEENIIIDQEQTHKTTDL